MATLQLLTWTDADGKATMWHSSAHLHGGSAGSPVPGSEVRLRPPLENGGFFYDVDLDGRAISDEELRKLEAKMSELAKLNSVYVRKEVPKADAIKYFTEKGDPYKIDLLQKLEDGSITFYTQGNFTDLCRGPHIPSTGFIKAVKLTNIAGAYWQGNENNKMLTRIYGITFLPRKSWTSTWPLSRKPKSATTASWARNWNCSPSPKR